MHLDFPPLGPLNTVNLNQDMWASIIDFASLLTESRFIIICIVLSGFPIDFLCGLQHRKAL